MEVDSPADSDGKAINTNHNGTTTSFASSEARNPSHILQDGRFVHLAEPSFWEQQQFLERSIARHGLLQHDLQTDKEGVPKEEDHKDEDEDDQTAPKVHPLVLASARLQNDGINELNRVINLSTLVQTGEYFGMSNIVAETALELAATETKTSTTSSTKDKTQDASAETSKASEQKESLSESQRIHSKYILKRKFSQFQQAAKQLQQHHQSLETAIVAEHRPLQRLRQWRPHWRLVAPEHGTRAAPHAARATEIVAAHVDIYTAVSPRRSVPPLATIAWNPKYADKIPQDVAAWRERRSHQEPQQQDPISDKTPTPGSPNKKLKEEEESSKALEQTINTKSVASSAEADDGSSSLTSHWTRAVPFAIADPALGKVDTEFDPSKVAMLTLEFSLECPCSGWTTHACMDPPTRWHSKSQQDNTNSSQSPKEEDDTQVLIALQHSLFCSKMCDSIRREVASDTEEVGQVRSSASQAERSTIWLSKSETREQFLPTPGVMVRGDAGLGQGVAVIHCHEGEVMVQLDSEYTLKIKLVEANQPQQNEATTDDSSETKVDGDRSSSSATASGGHTPAQLLVLCRALMLHAQEIYHAHSLKTDAIQQAFEADQDQKPGLALIRRAPKVTSPHILQKCICLGSKMLMERRVRATLNSLKDWVASQTTSWAKPCRFLVEWLPLSALDPHAQFTVSLENTGWYADVHLTGHVLSVTSFLQQGGASGAIGHDEYRKVDFYSEQELELFLKRAILLQLKAMNNM